MTTSVFQVADMHCSACESRIRTALGGVPGIRQIKINPIRRELFVDHDANVMPMLELFGRIENTGFSPVVEQSGGNLQHRQALKRLGVAGIAMMQVMMQALALYAGDYQGMAPGYVRLFEITSLLFCIPVVFYSAQPFFQGAYKSLRAISGWRSCFVGLSMDVPVAVAIAVAFSASVVATAVGTGAVYYDSVVMFTFLLLLARFIDQRISARLVNLNYLSLLPAHVWKISADGDQKIQVQQLVPGDVVRIRPGERVPADGIVLAGCAQLDEALLTGESDAVTRLPGDRVTAGTLNYDQPFTARVMAAPADSRLAAIEAIARQAELDKPAFVQRADRIAGVFVAAMLLIALGTLGLWLMLDATRALSATLAVLVVSCPCALALATPAAVTAALNFLRARGVIVTSGAVLEAAADIRALALDKTGTLTTGSLVITELQAMDDMSENQILAIAAGLERDSRHPIASAFVHERPERFEHIQVGADGIEGHAWGHVYRIGTAAFCGVTAPRTDSDNRRVIWLCRDHRLIGKFRLIEKYRRDTQETLQGIQRAGITTQMFSGDSAHNCEVFASLMDCQAQLDPAGKLAALQTLRQRSGPVMMVGDGVNDIPVLANADVSAAVMESPDLVKSKADVILLTNRLRPVLDFLLTSRRVRQVIRQNLFWAIAYNVTMIPLAAAGLIPPWAAALGMSASSLLVTLNAARLNRGHG